MPGVFTISVNGHLLLPRIQCVFASLNHCFNGITAYMYEDKRLTLTLPSAVHSGADRKRAATAISPQQSRCVA